MRAAAIIAPLILLASCLGPARQDLTSVGAGDYALEAAHASVTWRVKHLGLSWYTARFTQVEAALDFDPANPAASRVRAVINPLSVRADHPTNTDWDRQLGADILEGDRHPRIVFQSTSIESTGPYTGKVTGDLAFLGVTRPVTLDVVFNGALTGSLFYRGRDAVGFSARTTLSRSDFGLARYASQVGDDVEIIIEAEFVKSR